MTTIYFVDTETGGLDPQVHSILSIGLVKWVDGEIVREYESYIQEDPIIVTPQAMHINKISIGTHFGPTPDQALQSLWHNIDINPNLLFPEGVKGGPDRPVIGGHNTPFDIGFVKRLCRLGKQPYLFHYRYVDTLPVARALIDAGRISPNNGGLSSLCEYFGIENKQRHGALGDARATAELYTKLLEVLKG